MKLQGVTRWHSGVDWLTVTFATGADYDRAEAVLTRDMLDERNDYGPIKIWSWKGYSGFEQRYAKHGQRPDSSIIIVVSDRADSLWRLISHGAKNCTRIDLCLDVLFDQSIRLAEQQFDRWEQHVAGTARSYRLIQSEKGYGTAYVGSWRSQAMARIYDKGAQTDSKSAGHWWRFEVQLRPPHSVDVLAQLQDIDAYRPWIAAWVIDWLGRRNCYVPDISDLAMVSSRGRLDERVAVRDARKRLDWLTRTVRPVASELAKAGYVAEVLASLGLRDIVWGHDESETEA